MERIIPGLPDEVTERILNRVPVADLVRHCRLVSRRWNAEIAREPFWRNYLSTAEKNRIPPEIRDRCRRNRLPWSVLASVARKNPFSRNLMRNCCGEAVADAELERQEMRVEREGLMEPWPEYPDWTIDSSAGEGWKVVTMGKNYQEDVFPDENLLPVDPVS